MFGLSLPKLLFTFIAVMVIWHGFKWFARYQDDRFADRDKIRKAGRVKPSSGAPDTRARETEIDSEEMVKCPVCETYVSASAAVSCGRNGCPYP